MSENEARPRVVALEDAASFDRSLLGGKGEGLARLVAGGVRVPEGFVVTTAAFGDYLSSQDLSPEDGSSRLSAAVREGAWPDALKLAIERALASFGDARVAVRSSATDEDSSGASFAGQHETLLDVRGAEAVLEAVRTCWASLFAAEALAYRAELGASGAPLMAVVVQKMVPADAAGVAFTVHPVDGDDSVVVVDLCEGLGDALVSGLKTPDHYVLSKAERAIVRRELAGARAVLADQRVRDVAELALGIEEKLGAAQDVEWALEGDTLWALQARPITKSVEAASSGELDTVTGAETTWTSTNVQEVLPGLLSPLSQSVVLRDFDRYTREALRRMGIKPRTQESIVGCFHGRAFLNLSLAQEIGGQTAAADEHYMGEAENQVKKSSGGGTLAKLRLAFALPKTLFCFLRLGAAIERGDELAQEPIAERAFQAYGARIQEHGALHVLTSIYSGAMFTILGKLAEKWAGDEGGALHGRLLSGLAGMDSARPAYDLWDIARFARGSAEMRAIVEDADADKLAQAKEGDAAKLRARVDAFLGEHGYHSVQGMELGARSWDEDVETVLGMLRNYLDADDDRSPAASEARARADREAAAKAATEKLGALQKPLFGYFLRAAQRWVPLREHTKSQLIRAMHERRKFFRELASDLVEDGALAHAWDIYYLTWGELSRLKSGELDRDAARDVVRRRRIEERQNRLVSLPETFTGKPVATPPEPLSLPDDRTLRGIAVSRGTVTGVARVVLDPRSDIVIRPGEILVAPVTDAAWAPLFTVAAGLVVDIGGALSHGSTVAREYGLPAVVNVKSGTRLIRTGDVITVDGTRGVVVLGT
jgi:rifampicin phosphotransferase